MKKGETTKESSASAAKKDEMRDEYDFSQARPNEYAERFRSHDITGAVVLDADVAEVFPDSESVNRALRALIAIFHDQISQQPTSTSR